MKWDGVVYGLMNKKIEGWTVEKRRVREGAEEEEIGGMREEIEGGA